MCQHHLVAWVTTSGDPQPAAKGYRGPPGDPQMFTPQCQLPSLVGSLLFLEETILVGCVCVCVCVYVCKQEAVLKLPLCGPP